MHVHPVTARYVEALSNLAHKAQAPGLPGAIGRDLERLGGVLAAGLAARITDRRLGVVQRRAELAAALTGMHELTRNFCLLAFDRRRESVVIEAPEAFRQRELALAGIAEGVVESPRPLSAGDLSELGVALSARLGGRVQLSQKLAPELVAGVRVRVGSKMLDVSAQGRMHELRRHMLAAPLPALRG